MNALFNPGDSNDMRVPLLGRCSIIFTVVDENGNPFVIVEGANDVQLDVYRFATDTLPLFTLTSGAGITVLSENRLLIDFGVNGAQFSAFAMFTALLTVTNTVTSVVIFEKTYAILPVRTGITVTLDTTDMAALLSLAFLNTRTLTGSVGGVGYLDGIATLTQPVGCVVQFYIDQNQPPQTWRLKAGTDAAVADAVVRPVDYNAGTNAKVWVRIS
jgi:hypothetical protein